MARRAKEGSFRDYIRGQINASDRDQLKQARAAAKQLRTGAKVAIREAREACLASVRPQLDQEDADFTIAVKGLRGERRRRKAALRSPCYAGALRGRLSAEPLDLSSLPDYLLPAVEPVRASDTADRDLSLRRLVSRSEKAGARRQRPRRTAGEVLREEDERALREIPEELHGLWYQIKGSLKASKRRSRAEAFAEWVESHPAEVAAYRAERQEAMQRELDRELAEEQARRAGAEERELMGQASPEILEAEIEEPEQKPKKRSKSPRSKPRSSTDLPVTQIKTFQSSELDDLVERAVMEGNFLNAWRIGALEVASIKGYVLIAPPGERVVKIKTRPNQKTKNVVEKWIQEQAAKAGQKRPLAFPRAEKAAPRALLPAASPLALLPPAAGPAKPPEATLDARLEGAQIQERDGSILLRFDERPRVEIRERLKRAGFRWWAPVTGNQHPAWRAPATEENRRVAIELARIYGEGAPARSDYDERRAGRIERLKTRAERAKQEASDTYERAREMASVIPFGEPIHVGHHSEGRDRRYRAKIERTYKRAFEQMGEAKEAERRARAAERNAAISSDDPDALPKLNAKLKELERVRALLPDARAALKKARDLGVARAALVVLGLDQDLAERLTPGGPLQRYAVGTVQRNLSSEIQRVRRRIDELKEREATAGREARIGGVRVVEEDNRLRIYFDGRPDEATRKALRSHGFLWAPSVGAWQRKPSSGAWYWARTILREAGERSPQSAPSEPHCCSSSAPLRLEPSEAATTSSAGRIAQRTSAQDRTASLFGTGGPVPPRAAPAPAPDRETGPDWLLTAAERTPSLYGPTGPVPPPPGARQGAPQVRLPFTR